MVQPCRRCGQMHAAIAGCSSIGGAARSTLIGEDEGLVGNIVADRYRIADVIGIGSTGTVFAAEHVTFARPAAMKVLRPRLADLEAVSRVFHGEARAAWSVSHPCLCEVFDIGTLPDRAPFFVMERLEGETLARRIARERLSLAAAVDVTMQLLSAIAAIHARDLLLRDLRPRNVYLAQRRGCRPLVKILDFGLARLTPLDRIREDWDALQSPAAGTGAAGGAEVPFYLSPERARGEHAVEPASDLFVAAVIFYEALTGERPFVSSSWSGLIAQITQGMAAPLHDRRSDVSAELSAFVARCLSPSPGVRPSSAKEMQDELRAVVEGARRASVPVLGSASIALAPAAHERGTHGPADEDETETRRSAMNGPSSTNDGIPRLNVGDVEDELSTAARRIDPALLESAPASIDEASAESTERTVPPPPMIDVEIRFDDEPYTSDAVDGVASAVEPATEEETATMELPPELQARVDQLMATNPAPVPVAPHTGTPRRRQR